MGLNKILSSAAPSAFRTLSMRAMLRPANRGAAGFACRTSSELALLKRGSYAVAGFGIIAGGATWLSPVKANEAAYCPPFTLSSYKFDQTTYLGRLYTVFDKIDPRTLLTSEAELKRCEGLLEEYEKTKSLPFGLADEDMWEARKTVESIIHPITKEPMFAPGRMSAFVLMDVPLAYIIMNARSAPAVIFAQWLNQTYNVMNNYVNRSSLDVDWGGLLKPYALAVSVSCSIALGAGRALQMLPALQRAGIFVPYFAVICAGACNVAFTRMDEWAGRGICIFSPEGEELGMSLKAGQQAVCKTICTRSVCLPIPVLLVPPVVMSLVSLTGTAHTVAQLVVIFGCLSFALPCALAILPQDMELSTASLEPQYQSLKDSRGKPITTVFANKGL